jgi:hypothetical protein
MSLHIEDLRRLCDDGDAGPEDKVLNVEVEEKTEVDPEDDEEGDTGERVRTRVECEGVSVSFRRSGSKGESTGDE